MPVTSAASQASWQYMTRERSLAGRRQSNTEATWFDGPGHYLLLAGLYGSVGTVLQALIVLLTR